MDYEEYIAQNLDRLPGKPKLIGQQYHTKGGIIDLLAEYPNGDLLVIEVKQGLISPWAWLQVLRYCGALMEQLGILNCERKVKGLLIGKALHKHAEFISRALPQDQFSFIPVDEIIEGSNGTTHS